jgi:S-adenosylmethionine hydrolase
MAIITLTTDFGWQDEYVGVMKGVILGIDPAARIVDITHGIDPQDVVQAAYTVAAACPFFPAGSIHTVVVDPGVGTDRAIVCLKRQGQFFLAPDNGVLSPLLRPARGTWLRRLENPALWRAHVSRTFHGRDIIAPAAAHLSRGVSPRKLGPVAELRSAVMIAPLGPVVGSGGDILGAVVQIDRFGNLLTDIDRPALEAAGAFRADGTLSIRVGCCVIGRICGTYAEGVRGEPIALMGSRGYLEIAVNSGSAAAVCAARKGEAVRIRIHRPVGQGPPDERSIRTS